VDFGRKAATSIKFPRVAAKYLHGLELFKESIFITKCNVNDNSGSSSSSDSSSDGCLKIMKKVLEIEPIFSQLQEFIDYKSINNLLNSTKSFEDIKKLHYY
jgi:hypothetical protein